MACGPAVPVLPQDTHEMADVHGSRAPPEAILRPMEEAGTANEWGYRQSNTLVGNKVS